MSANDQELLGQFTREQSEDAFTALVNRHLNLVYSAALRQVRSPQLAEEVSQSVFTQLARHAANLDPDTILTAWLYQVTRRAAIDVVRREARRQAREQIAYQMSDLIPGSDDWTHVEPLLDEAMASLEDTDRAAVLLRYFEDKSFREVGQAIGASEDAAQKRVSRAVERLRELLAERKVAIGTGALVLAISANAVQAAPAGLGAAVVAGAGLGASAAISTSTAVTAAKTIVMTTIQKTLIAVVITAAVGTAIYQTRRASVLSDRVQVLEQKQAQQADLNNQAQALRREHDRATNALAALAANESAAKKSPTEVLKLRGEVGRLRMENAQIASTNALSKATADPAARKLLRDQQKAGMGMIYKELAQRLKLTTEQTDKFNDLLADGIMESVGLVTTVLRDKPAPDQVNSLFASQDKAMQEQVEALLGADGLAQYQDYSRNLVGTLTAQQYKGMMTGTDDEKALKSQQFARVIEEASRAVLAESGLPADYQTVPILNFRNIASEQDGERSLKLLDDIYQRATANAASFLTADDLTKFQEFRKTALNNSRAALSLNRTFMAPIAN
ncbi:MAG TPA: sigma-70 family RNA polymerase sigma factor [Verrucomicrobiae bacterium]